MTSTPRGIWTLWTTYSGDVGVGTPPKYLSGARRRKRTGPCVSRWGRNTHWVSSLRSPLPHEHSVVVARRRTCGTTVGSVLPQHLHRCVSWCAGSTLLSGPRGSLPPSPTPCTSRLRRSRGASDHSGRNSTDLGGVNRLDWNLLRRLTEFVVTVVDPDGVPLHPRL